MSRPFRLEIRTCSEDEITAINDREGLTHARAYEPYEKTLERIEEQDSAGQSRLTSWARHPDERVPIALLRSPRHPYSPKRNKWWAGHRGQEGHHFVPEILRRGLEDADQAGEHWTPLLDEVWRSQAYPWLRQHRSKLDDLPSVDEQVRKLSPFIQQARPDDLIDLLEFDCLALRALVAQTGQLTPDVLAALSRTPQIIKIAARYNNHLTEREHNWIQDWLLDSLVACHPDRRDQDHREEIEQALQTHLKLSGGQQSKGNVTYKTLEKAAYQTLKWLWETQSARRNHRFSQSYRSYNSKHIILDEDNNPIGGGPPRVGPGQRVQLTAERQEKLVRAVQRIERSDVCSYPYSYRRYPTGWIEEFFNLKGFTERLSADVVDRLFDKRSASNSALCLLAHRYSHEGMWRKALENARSYQRGYRRTFMNDLLDRPEALELDAIWRFYLEYGSDGMLNQLADRLGLDHQQGRGQEMKAVLLERLEDKCERDRPTHWAQVKKVVENLLERFVASGPDLWRIYKITGEIKDKDKVARRLFEHEAMDETTVLRILEDTRSRNIRQEAVRVTWIRRNQRVREYLADTKDRNLLTELLRDAQGREFAEMFTVLAQKEPDEAVQRLKAASKEQLEDMTREDFLDLLVKGDQQAREIAIRVVSRIEDND